MPSRRRILLLLSAGALAAAASADRLSRAVEDYRAGEYAAAARVFESLARAGNPQAQFWMGTMHYQGRGRPRQFREALAWYRLAADGGSADAQNNLGLMHRNGEGVEPSRLLAYAWFSLAAAQGNTVAADNLAALTVSLSAAQEIEAQQLADDMLARIQSARRRPPAPVAAVPVLDDVFMVQIGLFQNPDNVARIRATLRREKLTLTDEAVTIRGQSYRRLRIGPLATATAARAMSGRLDAMLGVESAVIPVPRRR